MRRRRAEIVVLMYATNGICGCGGTAAQLSDKHEPAVCKTSELTPGERTFNLEHDGAARNYKLHVPPSYDGKTRAPLILNFHGYTSNADQQEAFSVMNAKSDAEGFVLAYPNGIKSSWNAGLCCGDSAENGTDDVGFARSVVADIQSRGCIDATRVYATGMSNGGFLSYLLGCEAADVFAAVAPVASVLGIPPDDCKPSRPMPLIAFNGTADDLVHYEGGGALNFPSVADTFWSWGLRDSCTDTPTRTFEKGKAHCETYSACADGARVTECTIEGEGHCWPGQSFCPFGHANTDISANDAMWSFFKNYAL